MKKNSLNYGIMIAVLSLMGVIMGCKKSESPAVPETPAVAEMPGATTAPADENAKPTSEHPTNEHPHN